MREHFRLMLLVMLATLAVMPPCGAQEKPFTRAADGFSAGFPKPPEETSDKDGAAVYHYFRVFDDHVLYQVAHSQAAAPLQAGSELKDALDGMVAGMKGRLLASETIEFDAGQGRRLPALTFFVENDKVSVTGTFVVDGKHLYGINAATEHGFDRHVAADRFVQSLKLLPPAPQ
jgi:hypothetical protein